MFFFSILGICVEKTYISMRPWARQCESNGRANLFMILAVSLSVFFLVVVIVLSSGVRCVRCKSTPVVVEHHSHTRLSLTEFKQQQGGNNLPCAPLRYS